jgi:hypothetical protein
MAAKANIVIDQGATFNTELNLTDNNGNPLDLTGYTAEGQIRKWYTSSNATSFTVSIPSPTTGTIYLSLTANQTGNLWYGRYVYDIITVDSANTVTRVVEGIATVTPEVTQYAAPAGYPTPTNYGGNVYASFTQRSSPPTATFIGQVYYDTTLNGAYIWTGSSWSNFQLESPRQY